MSMTNGCPVKVDGLRLSTAPELSDVIRQLHDSGRGRDDVFLRGSVNHSGSTRCQSRSIGMTSVRSS